MTDEVEAQLAAATSKNLKMDALNALAWELRHRDIKLGLELAQTAFSLSQTEGYQNGLGECLVTQSQIIPADFDLALSQGYQTLAIFEQLDDFAGQSRTLYTLCWAHWFTDNFVKAIGQVYLDQEQP